MFFTSSDIGNSLSVADSSLHWCHNHQDTGYSEYVSPTPREIFFSCSGLQTSAPSLQPRSLPFRQKKEGHLPPLNPQHRSLPSWDGGVQRLNRFWTETWIQVSLFSGVCPWNMSLLPKAAPPSPPISPREMSNGVVFSNAWVRHLSLGIGYFPSTCFMLGMVMAGFETGFSKLCKSPLVTSMLLNQSLALYVYMLPSIFLEQINQCSPRQLLSTAQSRFGIGQRTVPISAMC